MITAIEESRSLSYEGMEIVASCDAKKPIHFAEKARKVWQVKVTPEIKEKCTVEGKFDYEKAKQMVLQRRIELLKKLDEGMKEPTLTLHGIQELLNNSKEHE